MTDHEMWVAVAQINKDQPCSAFGDVKYALSLVELVVMPSGLAFGQSVHVACGHVMVDLAPMVLRRLMASVYDAMRAVSVKHQTMVVDILGERTEVMAFTIPNGVICDGLEKLAAARGVPAAGPVLPKTAVN